MSKKKKILIALGCISCITLIVISVQYTVSIRRQRGYDEAVAAYESNEYEEATNKLEELPEGYKDRDSMLEKLNDLSKTYTQALELIEEGEFEAAITTFQELPLDYYDTEVFIENMWKLEILTASNWGDIENNTEELTWIYLVRFSTFAYKDKLELWLSEDEYSKNRSGNVLMGEYLDTFNVVELLETNEYHVRSNDRDDFTINISEISEGRYTLKNAYVTVTYVQQD